MSRHGNLYDNAVLESFMNMLKVEGVCLMALETEEDVALYLPRLTTPITSAVCTQLSDIRLPTRSRRTSSEGREFSNLENARPKGPTPAANQSQRFSRRLLRCRFRK